MQKSADPPPYTPPHPPPVYQQDNIAYLPSPQTVIVAEPSMLAGRSAVIGHIIQYGPSSQPALCPYCCKQVLTRVEAKISTGTHTCAGLLCLLMLWPLVPLPYLITSCKDRNHYCPNCKAHLGTYPSI